ncbi:MAG: lactate utilization protein B [bacterium]
MRTSVTGGVMDLHRKREERYAEIDSTGWRDWARDVKDHVVTRLDRLLEQAAQNLEANGVRVHWAETAADVRRVLVGIVRRRDVRVAVKAKSMLSEELEVNRGLETAGVEVFETDLGEWIVQLEEGPPSHLIVPAIHRDLDAIRRLFRAKLDTPLDAEPDALAGQARATLREAFLQADLGISGCNFLVAETGTVALIENEGNIRLSTSAPPVHVALVGIEKLLPRWEDLSGFLQLTSRAATGQTLGTFVSLLNGPKRADEPDGPEEMHVVLVDNGRSSVLADPEAWETLRCVRCAACLNACPVYRQTGGHAWGHVYSGPIGSVLDPALLGLERAGGLAYASSLCGACADACPVRIPIPELLLSWRARMVGARHTTRTERVLMDAYARIMTRPWLYRLAGRLMRRMPGLLSSRRLPLIGEWVGRRSGLEPSARTFREIWRAGLASPDGGGEEEG